MSYEGSSRSKESIEFRCKVIRADDKQKEEGDMKLIFVHEIMYLAGSLYSLGIIWGEKKIYRADKLDGLQSC